MSIHSSLCPHAHWAMYFWDMMWVSVRLGRRRGTIAGSARNAAFSVAVICVGVWPSSRLRAFTKSMCARDAVAVRRQRRRLVARPVRRLGLDELQLAYVMDRQLRLVGEEVAARAAGAPPVPA